MFDRGTPRGTGLARFLRPGRYCAQLALILLPGWGMITTGAAEDRIAERRTSEPETSSAANFSRSPTLTPSRATIAQYQAHCALCHDPDGRGETGRDLMKNIPDFTNEAWQSSQTDSQIRHAIHEGQGRVMPRFRGKLPPDDVENLVVLVRRFRGGQWVAPEEESASPETKPSPVPPTSAPPATPPTSSWRTERAIFQRSCQICHGSDGRGSSNGSRLAGVPDFTNRSWQASRSPAQLEASILEGKGQRMPGFRDKLGAGQAVALVSFVRSFASTSAQPQPPAAPSGDFDRRLSRLQREFEELRRAYRNLSPPPPAPRP
jgi:mono/diheme cytochrome c family protein